jgi:hypothetical protein
MVQSPLTIDQQIEDLRRWWPSMRAKDIDRRRECARWVGEICPQFTSYRIELRYAVWSDPEVRVLSPPLAHQPGNAEGVLPHVYGPLDDPTLCLWDPAADQWGPHLRLAETILPWSAKWLACYEFWVITGQWVGGGRHSDRLPSSLSGLTI